MDLSGLLSYLVLFGIVAGIYAVLSLGLNVHWGYTGLFNIGVAGFFAVGAYTSAILTTGPAGTHLGGLGLPIPLGFAGAGLAAAVIAVIVGLPTLRLRDDYLAITTIGIAETLRLVLQNEAWLSGGVWGISAIPKPMAAELGRGFNHFYFGLVVVAVIVTYWLLERGIRSPWGRVLKAIREDEDVALASGKNAFRFKMESLVLGAVIMGMAGALYAHFVGYISPDAFEPMQGTFLVWVMLIVGGSGNNLGAIAGAFLVWAIWTGTEFVTGLLPSQVATQASAARIILIGLLLEVVLLTRPQGLLGEERTVSRLLGRIETASASRATVSGPGSER